MANTNKELSASVNAGALVMRDVGKYANAVLSAGASFRKETGKNVTISINSGTIILHDVSKNIGSFISVGPLILHGISKNLSSNAKASATALHGTGKKLSANVKASPSVLHGIDKKLSVSVDAGVNVNKNTGKNIVGTINLTAIKEVNAAALTMVYNGNAELGLGAEEGAQFDIIVTGTFTVFSISMNGKTLTYTENCVAQTITIDNVNATVKNGATNKLSKVTGDVMDFLKLIPGDNLITYSKTGGSVDFTFDFRPQFI